MIQKVFKSQEDKIEIIKIRTKSILKNVMSGKEKSMQAFEENTLKTIIVCVIM